MNKFAKHLVIAVLSWQLKRLYRKNKFQVVAVAGSIGKTSTKLAVAKVLGQKYKVQYQDGNYNDVVTVPLIFFGLDEPSLRNPFAWFKTFLTIEGQLRKPYPYEVVVVEVGTDYPGNLQAFKRYLRANIGVVTAVTPEHMAFFRDLDAVAEEELTLAQFSEKLLVNIDLVAAQYLATVNVDATYGRSEAADYQIHDTNTFGVDYQKQKLIAGLTDGYGPQSYSMAAAVAVSHMLGLNVSQITAGLKTVQPASGRGQRLKGINNSLIIDDTYNASPDAVVAALEMLYKEPAKQRIAILGSMNELGDFSVASHQQVGAACDPKKLDLLVTIGQDAADHLAPVAQKNGCQVMSFMSPYEAGEYVKTVVKDGAVILGKGSQNQVFAEEAIKALLSNPGDAKNLVRQSPHWLKVKSLQFKDTAKAGEV